MAEKQLVEQDGSERLIALEECELKIRNAWRRGLESSVIIGTQLDKIARGELFRARLNVDKGRPFEDFIEYCENYHGTKRSTAYRLMEIAEAYGRFKKLELPMPENESQLLELVKLEPADQSRIWRRTIEICARAERPVTADRIRLIVEHDTAEATEAEPAPQAKGNNGGVDIDFDDGFGAIEQAQVRAASQTPPKPFSLSEEGERALDRIGRLCGQETVRAIEKQIVPLSQRELIKWAGQDDQTVRNLHHYVINERWSVAQALNYEARLLTGNTTVADLARLFLARGPYSVIHEEGSTKVQITVEQPS